jgi:hypothetical protein
MTKTPLEYFETGGEPEYFVTHTRTEQASEGNVRIFHYAKRGERNLHLLFTTIVPIKELVGFARLELAAATGHHLTEGERAAPVDGLRAIN